MTRRRAVAAAALLGLVLCAGCSMFGPGEVDEERLAEDADYGDLWNSTADVTIDVGRGEYRAVYQFENRSMVELHRFYRFNEERPLEVTAVQYRYPNGTIVGHEAMRFDRTRSNTVVTLPAREGELAVTAPKRGKRVRAQAVVEGSYEVILPPNARVGIFLLGRVLPGGYERSIEDGRVHLRWSEVTSDRVVVRYYLVRDVQLLSVLLAVAGVALLGGLVYFWLQLRELKERSAAVALDDDSR